MVQIAHALAGVVSGDVAAIIARLRRNAVLYAIASLFVLTAFVALLVAAGIYLATIYDPLIAALLLAAGAMFVAIAIVAALAIFNRIERRRRRRQARNSSVLAANAAIAALPYLMRSRTGLGLAAVAGVAYFLTRQRSDENTHE